jgi:hypothetical protein
MSPLANSVPTPSNSVPGRGCVPTSNPVPSPVPPVGDGDGVSATLGRPVQDLLANSVPRGRGRS